MPIFEVVHPGVTWKVSFAKSKDFRCLSPMMSVEFKSEVAGNMNPSKISYVFFLGMGWVMGMVCLSVRVDSTELILLVTRE